MISHDKPRIALLVPDGVGIRNFVLGPFLRKAKARHHIDALHPIPQDMLASFPITSEPGIEWISLSEHEERFTGYLLRLSLSYAQTYWVNNFVMQYNRNRRIDGSWKMKSMHRLAKAVGYLAGSPSGMRWLDRLHAATVDRFPAVTDYRNRFRHNRPAVLFCSHQRPTQILAPVLAAKSLGIPTATFIFSWDNLSSKGRISAPFDHFLVWSDHMQQELRRFYPDVTEDRIHIVGTPQFDPYADESIRWSREEFFARIGANPQRPLICYSGGDAGNVPADPANVGALMELIETNAIHGNPQLLVRPSPVDDGRRYRDVCERFPNLIFARPQWSHQSAESAGRVMPTAEDMQFLVNLVYHADMNVNFGSTMTLDFSIFDKPVVNIAYDVIDPPVYGMDMWTYLQKFEHYQPVIKLGAAQFAHSREELARIVNNYLKDPSLDREGRRRFKELEVGVPIGHSSETILRTLDAIAAG